MISDSILNKIQIFTVDEMYHLLNNHRNNKMNDQAVRWAYRVLVDFWFTKVIKVLNDRIGHVKLHSI